MNYVVISSSFFAVSAVITYYLAFMMSFGFSAYFICKIFILGFIIVLTFVLGLVFLFISTEPVSRHFSATRVLRQFLVEYGVRRYGKRYKAKFDSSCKNPRETQEMLLLEILKRSRGTAYALDNDISAVRSMEELKTKHKLTEYSHYKTYVERTAKGERNVLVTGLPERLVLTSGTTGTAKLIPVKILNERVGMQQSFIMFAIIGQYFPALRPMQPKLFLYCLPTLSKSEGGIDITALSYMPESTMKFGFAGYAPPLVAYRINSAFEAFYVQLLFGIREKGVSNMHSVFTTHVLEVMHILEKKWPQLVKDLATGSLNPDIKLSPEVRHAITRALNGGDPERAAELQAEFEKGFDGIMLRLWPQMSFIVSMDIINIKEQLERTYCKGITIYLLSYGGSEGLYGVNVDPFLTPADFVALVDCCVFEFIPEENVSESDPDTVFIDEVDVGKKYELVVTQESGLYRYRVGDVVQITGYHHKTPKMKFSYRIGTLLNMVGEKVSSDVVRGAVRDAVSAKYPDVSLIHQVVAESNITMDLQLDGLADERTKGTHYIFFLELEESASNLGSEFDTVTVAKSIDNNLYERHRFYRNYKDTNQIHQSTIYLVQPGSFYKLRDYVMANSSATTIQFKMPEKLRTKETFEVLYNSRLVK